MTPGRRRDRDPGGRPGRRWGRGRDCEGPAPLILGPAPSTCGRREAPPPAAGRAPRVRAAAGGDPPRDPPSPPPRSAAPGAPPPAALTPGPSPRLSSCPSSGYSAQNPSRPHPCSARSVSSVLLLSLCPPRPGPKPPFALVPLPRPPPPAAPSSCRHGLAAARSAA